MITVDIPILLAIADKKILTSEYLGSKTSEAFLKQLHINFANIHYPAFLAKMTRKMLTKLFSCAVAPVRTARHKAYLRRRKEISHPRGNRPSQQKHRLWRRLQKVKAQLANAPSGSSWRNRLETLKQTLEKKCAGLQVSPKLPILPLSWRLLDSEHDDRKHLPIEEEVTEATVGSAGEEEDAEDIADLEDDEEDAEDIAVSEDEEENDEDIADSEDEEENAEDIAGPVVESLASLTPDTNADGVMDASASQIKLMVKLSLLLLASPRIRRAVNADWVKSCIDEGSPVTLTEPMLQTVAMAVNIFRPFYPKMLSPGVYPPNCVLLKMPMLKICGAVLKALGFEKQMHAVVPEVKENSRYALRLTGPILFEMFVRKQSPGQITISNLNGSPSASPQFSLAMISAFFDIDSIKERCKRFKIPFNNA